MDLHSESVPVPSTKASSSMKSPISPEVSPTIVAKPKSTNKEKFKKLYNIDLDAIGHSGVRRMMKTKSPISGKSNSKQTGLSPKNEKKKADSKRECSSHVPTKSQANENCLKPVPPQIPMPTKETLLSEMSKEKKRQLAKEMEL